MRAREYIAKIRPGRGLGQRHGKEQGQDNQNGRYPTRDAGEQRGKEKKLRPLLARSPAHLLICSNARSRQNRQHRRRRAQQPPGKLEIR